MPGFLLEIGLEEIPAGMIAAAQAELERNFTALMERERLAGEEFAVKSYSTPRRLAVVAEGLRAKQADAEEQVLGPSTKVAYKDGAPTPAAVAFARKCGVDAEALQIVQTAKGDYVQATVRRKGQTAAEVLTVLLPAEIGRISWPKNMAWRAGRPEKFVRPVRWLLALLDEEALPLEFAGVTAGGVSYGHRVLHGEAPVAVRRPLDYEATLEAAFVQVDAAARKQRIRKALDAAARTLPGARWREDEELVDTVTNLTEWPSVIVGGFDPLRLPKEVLITVMRDHQKYFALEDAEGKLLPHFLAVLNLQVDDAGAAVIRHGNERVLRARFNDAQFFWDVDQKIPLVDRVEMLKHVTFQKELGSYHWKTERNVRTADSIVRHMFGQHFDGWKQIRQAVELAKADLTTEMVKEFTELQGIVGGLYAREQKHPEAVAAAIYEQYRPAGSNDPIPVTQAGAILALADKMTTIVEMFQRNIVPTGSKDPFALRRAGAGVVRILAENSEVQSRLHLVTVIHAANPVDEADEGLRSAVLSFMLDRLEFYLQDACGLRLQAARAVRNSGAAGPGEDSSGELVGYGHVAGFARELNAQTGSAQVLAVAELLKRAKNIQRQAREKGIQFPNAETPEHLLEPAEKELAARVTSVHASIQKNYREGRYAEVIAAIASLQPPLNAFFDSVMVMVEDETVRANRLALLARTESVVRWAADFSELASIQESA